MILISKHDVTIHGKIINNFDKFEFLQVLLLCDPPPCMMCVKKLYFETTLFEMLRILLQGMRSSGDVEVATEILGATIRKMKVLQFTISVCDN